MIKIPVASQRWNSLNDHTSMYDKDYVNNMLKHYSKREVAIKPQKNNIEYRYAYNKIVEDKDKGNTIQTH